MAHIFHAVKGGIGWCDYCDDTRAEVIGTIDHTDGSQSLVCEGCIVKGDAHCKVAGGREITIPANASEAYKMPLRAHCLYALRRENFPIDGVPLFTLHDCGVDNEQFYQGFGVAFTPYLDCASGNGASLSEAIDDALEFMATGDCPRWIIDAIEWSMEWEEMRAETEACADADGVYHYAGIRYNPRKDS
jgi:hypothetical protein